MSSNQVRTDVFPASVTVQKGDTQKRFEKVRVILTLDHVYIFQDSGPTPKLVFEDRLTSYTPPPRSTARKQSSTKLDMSAKAETEEGSTVSFLRSGGCGCGSKLKTARVSTLINNSSSSQIASKNDSA